MNSPSKIGTWSQKVNPNLTLYVIVYYISQRKSVTAVTLIGGITLKQIHQLLENPLFEGIDYESFTQNFTVEKLKIFHYPKGTIIVQENEKCASIGFILDGLLTAQQLAQDGKILTINSFGTNKSFGAALYSLPDSIYPFNIYAQADSHVVYIPFSDIKRFLDSSTTFSNNFIHFLSERIYAFSNKIQLLQYNDVRSRLIKYLSNESKELGSTTFELRHTKVAISNVIGVARPSVSRELKNMAEDQLIKISGRNVELLNTSVFNL